MARPTIDTVWGSTGSTSDPGDTKMNLGWVSEVPDFEIQNFWQERTDLLLQQLEQRGILEWDAATTYQIGAIALASDNLIYRSITGPNTNNDPIGSPTNWILLNDIPDDFIDQDMLADNSVGTDQIIDLNVTAAKLAALAVTTAKIDSLAVTAAKLATNAVETAKINALAVTPAKLATNAVETDKIADVAVTTAKIDNLAVTTGKLDDGAVTNLKLGTVDADQITYDPASDPIVTATDVQAAVEEVSNHVVDNAPTYDIRTADQTIVGTTLVVDNQLSVALATNSTYVVSAAFYYNTTDGTPAPSGTYGFNFPAGTTYHLTHYEDNGSNAAYNHESGSFVSTSATLVLNTLETGDLGVIITMLIKTTNTGNLVPKYATDQAGKTIVILEDSWMKVEKLP